MLIFDLVLCLFAVSAIRNAWFQGSIFESPQQFLKARYDASLITDPGPDSQQTETPGETLGETLGEIQGETQGEIQGEIIEPTKLAKWVDKLLPMWLNELLVCSFCLTYHVAFWVVLLGICLPHAYPGSSFAFIAKAFLYSFAVTGILQIAQTIAQWFKTVI